MSEDIKTKDLFVYIPIVLLIFGLIRLYVFYYCFNLNITYFISLSDSIISFNDNFLLLILLLIGIFIYDRISIIFPNTLIDSFIYNKIKKNNGKIIITTKKKYNKALIYTIAYLVLISSFSTFIINKEIKLFLILLSSFVYFLLILGIYIRKVDAELLRENQSFNPVKIILLTVSLVYLLMFSIYDAYTIKNFNKFYGTQITLEDKRIIISDTKITYIGKSQDFVFIYDLENKYTIAIPIGRVSEIIYKEK